MKSKKFVIFLLGILIVLLSFFVYRHRSASKVIADPESGQQILSDELTILTSGQDINSLIKPYQGKITAQVNETSSYQVKFQVSNLQELNTIMEEIKKSGANVYHSVVIESP